MATWLVLDSSTPKTRKMNLSPHSVKARHSLLSVSLSQRWPYWSAMHQEELSELSQWCSWSSKFLIARLKKSFASLTDQILTSVARLSWVGLCRQFPSLGRMQLSPPCKLWTKGRPLGHHQFSQKHSITDQSKGGHELHRLTRNLGRSWSCYSQLHFQPTGTCTSNLSGSP